jgi:hypothetical protein
MSRPLKLPGARRISRPKRPDGQKVRRAGPCPGSAAHTEAVSVSVAVDIKKRDVKGRYSFDGRLERVCVCGHTLGEHAGGTAPHDCLHGGGDQLCGCKKFRPSRRADQ